MSNGIWWAISKIDSTTLLNVLSVSLSPKHHGQTSSLIANSDNTARKADQLDALPNFQGLGWSLPASQCFFVSVEFHQNISPLLKYTPPLDKELWRCELKI